MSKTNAKQCPNNRTSYTKKEKQIKINCFTQKGKHIKTKQKTANYK